MVAAHRRCHHAHQGIRKRRGATRHLAFRCRPAIPAIRRPRWPRRVPPSPLPQHKLVSACPRKSPAPAATRPSPPPLPLPSNVDPHGIVHVSVRTYSLACSHHGSHRMCCGSKTTHRPVGTGSRKPTIRILPSRTSLLGHICSTPSFHCWSLATESRHRPGTVAGVSVLDRDQLFFGEPVMRIPFLDPVQLPARASGSVWPVPRPCSTVACVGRNGPGRASAPPGTFRTVQIPSTSRRRSPRPRRPWSPGWRPNSGTRRSTATRMALFAGNGVFDRCGQCKRRTRAAFALHPSAESPSLEDRTQIDAVGRFSAPQLPCPRFRGRPRTSRPVPVPCWSGRQSPTSVANVRKCRVATSRLLTRRVLLWSGRFFGATFSGAWISRSAMRRLELRGSRPH